MQDHLKWHRDEATLLGAKDLVINLQGRHPSLVGCRADGSPFRIVVRGTPSCSRTLLNERSRLRRKLVCTAKETSNGN
jgi:hypothetical protein